MVVIHNNDHNSFDEVIDALIRATGCGVEEASIEAWEAHHYGKAPVHFAEQQECSTAAVVIARVGIVTEVVPEWTD
ncbi:MAG: ATP-dependent Clp protease adaptor ClpS [Fimbriimonadaceae bacterium]|nr:ATP-dependent Clp protease adaptor ClpS [Fimbriimonadaceae bacterium]